MIKSSYDAYIFDLDGTVYLGDTLLPYAGETIQQLRYLGKKILFLSNNPTRARAVYAEKLTRFGLPTPAADVINCSYVMADFLQRRLPRLDSLWSVRNRFVPSWRPPGLR